MGLLWDGIKNEKLFGPEPKNPSSVVTRKLTREHQKIMSRANG